MPGSGLISYWSIVRTGSRDEIEPGKSGYAHFFEHMMFRGTKKHPDGEYDRLVTAMGADANAFTENDLTCLPLDLRQGGPAAGNRAGERPLPEAPASISPAFQTEAGAVYGEFRKDETQPDFMLDEKLHDTAFDVHTYKHTTMGFEADVKAMPKPIEYSRQFSPPLLPAGKRRAAGGRRHRAGGGDEAGQGGLRRLAAGLYAGEDSRRSRPKRASATWRSPIRARRCRSSTWPIARRLRSRRPRLCRLADS